MENIGKWSCLSSLISKTCRLENSSPCSLQISPLFLLNGDEFTIFRRCNAKKKRSKQTNKNKSGIYIYLIKGTKSIPQENPQSWISEVKHKFICTTAHPLFLYYSYLSTSFQKETQQPLNIGLCIHHVPQQIFALWWNQRPQQEWNYSH